MENNGSSNNCDIKKDAKTSILELKSISVCEKFKGEKSAYKNWIFNLKNVMLPVVNNVSLEFWMDVAERCIKNPSGVWVLGTNEDEEEEHVAMYESIGKMLRTLLIDKFSPETEGYLIIKRNDDGIKGHAEIHRHYTEISGPGIRDMTTRLMNPERAKADDDVLRCVELWEDQYKEALRHGVTPLDDMYKTSILEDIATDAMREKIEQEFYTKYEDAKEHRLRIARKKH